ncbi:glycoside hydrolase family 2 TIM barrel-domain containing protein [Pedobacter gandavensis]|uniref:DUF4982 domain-containing protein n=1 Tax=Pedobacter gandavensis TaxID=2679963 RepID=A0ABR6EQU9_9SPHI|nr:glycoside hydrolase family 2 TIM barrel-domain containing protein [Pedobacter gandavensis]MBB2147619.1 DUF4982 domain-containing protein [Pedobacter gandavensis]
MKKNYFAVILLSLSMMYGTTIAQSRSELLLEENWRFTREDQEGFTSVNYNDSKWQQVTVPHDWAIYGPFSANNDKQHVAIAQDGQKQASEHAGRTGGLPFVGVGWYRNKFMVPKFNKGKKATIIFDGAMSNATVYLNGKKVGFWPYGYNTFHFDITEFLEAGKENTLAVRLENFPESSRWYPGAGLYRNVHVVVTEAAHIPVWGTQLSTPVINKEFAKVNIKTKLVGADQHAVENFLLSTEIMDPKGKVVSVVKTPLSKYDQDVFSQELVVLNPVLWDTENPALYTAVSKLYEGNELRDEYKTTFGIRSIEIIPNKGFFLNGKRTQFKGVCLHHDLGPLGAAVNDAAIRRQIRIMKDMGVNAIRTSHNMPAPEFVKACDEMGMMLMAETFDEWKEPKQKNGYNKYFDQWAEKDLVNLIHHYRNNPSVVMWCIGNEVPEQGMVGAAKIAKFLQDICFREDPSRFVTQGMDQPGSVINNNFAATMQVAGFNYRPFAYPEAYKKLPQQLILGTETASTISSRGIYKFPVVRRSMPIYEDLQVSSYDVEHCGWSDLPEDNFIQHDDLPYAIGEFVWTGFDYLGEPTPYYTNWPSHSSLFGIVDLAGIPKDRYYLYRSHWNTAANTLHILPSWNFKDRVGQTTPVFVYTNYPTAELFINGKSQGRKTKDTTFTVYNTGDKKSLNDFDRQKRYRLMWMDTKYEPGTVKVIAYDAKGNMAEEKEIRTAGKPHHLELKADRMQLAANGKDLSFVLVNVVDKDGNLCSEDTREISFKAKGAGKFHAVANGNSASLESFQAPKMKAFSGQLTAIVKSDEKQGVIYFEASAKGLKSTVIKIEVK